MGLGGRLDALDSGAGVNDCRFVPAGATGSATLYLREYEKCQCGLLTYEQANALSQHYNHYLQIQPAWQAGAWELTARQHVGAIVLNDLRVIIEPKVNLQNLFYMLTFAHDLADFRREAVHLATGDDLFEFIVVIFLRQVERLVQRGIYRTYVTAEENQSFLRGRLMLADHLRRNALHVQRFYQRTNEFTADVLENCILRYTLGLLSRLEYRDSTLRPQIHRVASAFAEVSLTPIAPSDCDRVVYTRLNAPYRTRVNLARLLIRHLSLEGRAGSTEFASYLLDMNKVFELFVARFLSDHFANNTSIQVEIQPDIWLDADHQEKGIPDIVLRQDGRRYLVLDTKYKRFHVKPDKEDRNQMVTYCHTLGLSRGILIYADDHAINYGASFNNIVLDAQSLSLHGNLNEFQARCRQFAQQFEDRIQ
jgi:5-methylcytosine-specific restriction enzyme subunit McrC